MAVDISTIRTDVWDTLYTYMKTTNPISTSNVYSALNSRLVDDVGYPFVVINPPSVAIAKETIGGSYLSCDVAMMIEIYHTSSASVKSLTDDVTNTLLEGRDTFAGNRLVSMEIDEGDYDFWDEGNSRVHKITFNVSFRYSAGTP